MIVSGERLVQFLNAVLNWLFLFTESKESVCAHTYICSRLIVISSLLRLLGSLVVPLSPDL